MLVEVVEVLKQHQYKELEVQEAEVQEFLPQVQQLPEELILEVVEVELTQDPQQQVD
tara:strand:- start:68 stop:238 length:171 start_codon:yes stop_codon:yes gene_type:complete